jgi:hypothetical protein
VAPSAVRAACLFLFVPVPTMLVGLGLPLALVFLAASAFRLPAVVVSLGLVLAIIVGGTAGLVAGLAVPYRMLKRRAERARGRAREIVRDMEATTAVVCPACGGRAAVVALGPDEPCPCPWCGAPLLPAASGGSGAGARTARPGGAGRARSGARGR